MLSCSCGCFSPMISSSCFSIPSLLMPGTGTFCILYHPVSSCPVWPHYDHRFSIAGQMRVKTCQNRCHVAMFKSFFSLFKSVQVCSRVSNSVGRPLLAVSTVTYQATTCRLVQTSADYWRHAMSLCTLWRTFSMKQQHAVPAGSWRVWSSQISGKDSAVITCDHLGHPRVL